MQQSAQPSGPTNPAGGHGYDRYVISGTLSGGWQWQRLGQPAATGANYAAPQVQATGNGADRSRSLPALTRFTTAVSNWWKSSTPAAWTKGLAGAPQGAPTAGAPPRNQHPGPDPAHQIQTGPPGGMPPVPIPRGAPQPPPMPNLGGRPGR